MMNSGKKRAVVLLTAVALLFAAAVGGTIAYLMAQTSEVVNTFTPTNIDISVEEEFSGNVKENVVIRNNGNIPAYIRAMIIVTWQDEHGNVHAQKPVEVTDYTLVLGNSPWKKENDGFYYYQYPVAAEGITADLISSCTPVEGKAPAGYNLHVEILAQAIQADGLGVSSAKEAFAAAKGGTT